jgi:hypothetical protein
LEGWKNDMGLPKGAIHADRYHNIGLLARLELQITDRICSLASQIAIHNCAFGGT